MASDNILDNMRHSAAHLLAAAVQKLWPEVKLGVGPVIENGFYYDFDLDYKITEEDLPKIEAAMKDIGSMGHTYEREEVSVSEAKTRLKEMNQPYKVELIESFEQENIQTVTFYTTGDFVDLCRGGHVANSKDIGPYKLLSIAGAYWRGKSDNPQLQRIYGTCWPTQEELDQYLAELEEAKKRDHRKLGKDLGLFTFDELVGPGLPIWLPKGTVLREELEKLAKEKETEAGYHRVVTPHIAREELYRTSGHLPYYAETMFPPMESEDSKYYLKAMNCPHMHVAFRQQPVSYRDLPVRWAEFGTVYRDELSGTLAGLMRVRALTQNDAHIYCREDQIEDEFLQVMELHKFYNELFGIKDFYMRLSLHDPANKKKYIDEPEMWKFSEDAIRRSMAKSGLPVQEAIGEAAFYGPKIDFQVRFIGGREETLATNQLDFAAKNRFGLHYTGADGSEQPIYVIHRAPLGTHERFVAFLIEHYAGAFPTWLAPIQVKVIPISEKVAEYADKVAAELKTHGIRYELADSNVTLGKNVRDAQLQKIPYMLVVGAKEAEANTVSVRSRDKGDKGVLSLTDWLRELTDEIENRL